MVRDYILLFIFGAPIFALTCLLVGQFGLAIAVAGIYYAAFRLAKATIGVLFVAALWIGSLIRLRMKEMRAAWVNAGFWPYPSH